MSHRHYTNLYSCRDRAQQLANASNSSSNSASSSPKTVTASSPAALTPTAVAQATVPGTKPVPPKRPVTLKVCFVCKHLFQGHSVST